MRSQPPAESLGQSANPTFESSAEGEAPAPRSLEAFHAREALNHALIQAAGIESAMPHGFTNWDLKVFPPGDADGWETVAHIHAGIHVFPADFPWWESRNSAGYSVAHVAAMSGTLPWDFAQWDIQGPDGFTVGHALIASGATHSNFNAWNLADADGSTPAHVAAHVGVPFPDDFDQWDLRQPGGPSVAEIVVALGHPDKQRAMKALGLPSEESAIAPSREAEIRDNDLMVDDTQSNEGLAP